MYGYGNMYFLDGKPFMLIKLRIMNEYASQLIKNTSDFYKNDTWIEIMSEVYISKISY